MPALELADGQGLAEPFEPAVKPGLQPGFVKAVRGAHLGDLGFAFGHPRLPWNGTATHRAAVRASRQFRQTTPEVWSSPPPSYWRISWRPTTR